MATYHYSRPPPGYVVYQDDYPTSTSTTPSPEDAYDYYVPQYRTPLTPQHARTTSKRHTRTTSYSTPRPGGWHSPAGYPSPGYYATNGDYQSPPRPSKYDYVSNDFTHTKTKARRFSVSGQSPGARGNVYEPDSSNTKRRASVRTSQKQRNYVVDVDEADFEPVYVYAEPKTTYTRSKVYMTREPSRSADSYFYHNQVPVYDRPAADTPIRSRARRASQPQTRPKSSPSKPSRPVEPPREATPADALAHNIPAGYSLKNWDPTEEPILLLGSVFDANSLGKWIYDWTVYHHRAASPFTEIAGDLWLLLIKFAGKMKRAEEGLPRIKRRDDRDLIRDFEASGQRIWSKLQHLLKACEEFMWRAAKRDGAKGTLKMGEKSGIEFVKSIFGRDRELERTEKLMASVRTWVVRFDANCEEILRRPGRD
jgi:hypothetical protein